MPDICKEDGGEGRARIPNEGQKRYILAESELAGSDVIEETFGADGAIRSRDEVVVLEVVPDGPLDALTGDAGPAVAAELGVLGTAGVVAVQI